MQNHGCSGHMDVNILLIRMQKNGCSGHMDVHILLVRMQNHGCSGHMDANILLIIRVQKTSMQWSHGCSHLAYPYAKIMDAVVTWMLISCLCIKKKQSEPENA